MQIIVLASQKGGVGTTTLAAHLAVAAEAAGDGPAVLIDTDPQGSLSAWWNVRAADTPALAPSSIAELAGKVQHPGRVIGVHFFSPVPVMKLVEIIRGLQTSDATHGRIAPGGALGGKSIETHRLVAAAVAVGLIGPPRMEAAQRRSGT